MMVMSPHYRHAGGGDILTLRLLKQQFPYPDSKTIETAVSLLTRTSLLFRKKGVYKKNNKKKTFQSID